ncbi:protein split ends isoform X2 [Calliphora vicina]|uniref:protein split ends isoform X2 n=1 Tax=Calliphora vicina TaxID=7373 RepID=UPI00325B23E9
MFISSNLQHLIKNNTKNWSTEDVSPPNFSERNSGYYERNSRLVSESDSYLRRSNNNNYQSSSSSSNNTNNSNSSSSSNNNSSSNNPDNRSRTRDRLYRNGPNAVGVSTTTTTGSSAATLLSERTSSGASSKINNSRVPPTSWYEAAATYTNGPGGSGNADVSAANINHYQTAASTELQAAAAATTNSTTTSSYTAYSYASSPAHNNNNHNTTSTTTTSSSRNSTFYGKDTDKDSETNLSTTPPLLNKNKHKLLKSSSLRSGSASPTASSASATLLIGGVSGAVLATMTSSSSTAASTSSLSSTSNNNNNNNSRSNQTANNSCSSVSSTINSSNTNNNNSLSGISSSVKNTNRDDTHSGSGNVSGILNAAALAAAASKGGSSSLSDGHKNHSSSVGGVANSSSNASGNTSSNNPSTSASHHTSRSAAHGHFHGRSTTSSSRSHSRSPSSYSSSHSSSSSSSSTASSHSHASSPVGGRDVEVSSVAHASSSRSGSRSLQSAVAVPGTSSGLNPSGSNVCGSSSSSTSSTSSGTPTGNPVVHSEDNRPLAIRVRNLPARSSDTSLKDGLFHEYKKHGKVTWVKVVGQNAERYALVCFKKPEDVEKALEVSHDKLFFGCKIEVEPYQGYDVEDNEFRPYEAELDEYHPKSTRTLFIGNLEKEITASELRQHFECFGEIIEIDIKKQGMSAYAFCQYSDIVSVVKAMRKMDGEHLGNNRIKLGFGKSMPTNCVWIDGIGEKISESHLQSQFSRYGAVSKVVVDRQRQLALVLYEQIQYAQTAVKEMRGATLRGRKLQVDFASRECQDAFYEKLEKQSAGSRFNRYESQSRSRASSFSRHQNSNDGCSPGNTPGSSSSSSAGVPSSAPALSSAIVAGSSALSVSNTASGNTLASVVGQTSGNTTPARSRGSRSSRHTMDYEYLDTRRFRSCDEYSQGSATSHDEDNSAANHPSSNINSYSGIGLRSDSPLLSRLGPIVNSSGKESSSEMLEMALSRRRCDKSPAKQKGDIRLFQKERAVLLEQLEECPSSGDESIVSPRKRIKIDHHSINSSSGLTQSHSLDEQQQQQPQHKNSNCDYLLNDPMHRKSEVRRLSECNSSLNKYPTPQQNHHHSHHAVPPPPPPHHHHHQQQLSRRPSIDFMATSGGGGGAGVAGGVSNLSTRHNSTSSSNSDHHPPPHQSSSSSSSSLACKRRRVIGSSSSTVVSAGSLLSGSTGGTSNLPAFANDDSHHHTSRGRGHQLHSHHSHEASGGESADGSRPGTPLCDERPEVLPSEPRRVPRERPREPMVLPLPKFGIQFFQQYRNSVAAGNTPSYHHHHHVGFSFTSSSAAALGGGNNSGNSHLLSNSIINRGEGGISNNSHSSLSHSSATITPASAAPTGTSSGSCYLPSPSTRYPHWRPNHLQHHHQQHGGAHHSASGGATPSSSSSMVSPMRSRSLSSNSSDSDIPGQSATGSPSLEERIRSLDEMYERWSGSGMNMSNTAVGPNVVKRHDFNHTPPIWQHHRSNSQSDSHHASTSDGRSNATPSTSAASRHKFLDIDVKEIKPSDIVKSVLAKKSIFDDDLQRLKKNHWYEPSSDSGQQTKAIMGVCTSPGLPNLQATKTPVVGCTTTSVAASAASSTLNKPSGNLLQRLTSISPMNSPQASMSPHNSPSPSPSVTLNSVPTVANPTMTKASSLNNVSGVTGPQTTTTTAAASTSPAASGGTKCLQYPFPTHPPLPNTAAPVQSAQPIPPPPAESSKPSMAQPPLPPMEVLQPPQPPATSPTSSTGSSTKPKTSALLKSLSVPPPPPTTATTESRIFTKSVSVPGSTNLGTVKSTADAPAVSLTAAPHLEQNQPQQTTTGSSSLHPSKSHNKEDDTIAKPPSHTSSASTSDSVVKRSEKSHKHNHRSSEDKKSTKSDRRKNSNSSQSHLSQASAAESSDADEHDSKKERKERQERREKELRKQQDREERDREEKERLEKERLEAERLEKDRLERERLEKEERERVQREKERLRKEEEQRAKEERERKEREEKERKQNEQKEREQNERREREEAERREREEQLRKERKEREEHEQKEKEKLERQRMREEKERERKSQDEANNEHKRDINLLKEHQRRKENASSQSQTKTGNDMATATSQSAHDFFRQGETERQNNKENSTDETTAVDTPSASSCKHKNRKTSRNTSPVRHPKRRLSSQDSNASNSAASVAYTQTDDHAKRMRIDLQSAANQPQTSVNNHNSVNNAINERRDSKEHHVKERSNKHNRDASSGHKGGNTANQSNEKEHNKHHRNKHHHKAQPTSQASSEANDVNVCKQETEHINSNCTAKAEDDQQNIDHDMELKPKIPPLLSSDDDEGSENPNTTTQHHNKNVSGNHKHREHGSGHHSRHKSNKREREHHREKKRYSSSTGPPNSANINDSVPSTPPFANCNVTDEEIMSSAGNQLAHRRTSGQSTVFELNTKSKHESSDRKLSRCSEDGSAAQPQTPSHRQNNFNKNTPQSSARRMLLSSAEDTDGGDGVVGMGADDDDDSDNRQHSIFDIPDDGPYVSMYDKVKARSCKNMQKQEEEKKIKAKFSQLKQSRAKREEKKRSTSYDGDSDSDFDGASSEHQKHNRSGGSYKMLTGGLSSSDDDQDMEAGAKTPSRDRRRSSQASSSATSIHPNRLCSDSDDNSITQRRLKLQDNIRRLCDDGDDTSEDDLIRRHNSSLATKRLLHHTSRIASDSESQSQSAVDIKLKQEPLETSNDGATTPVLKHLKQKIKKEVEAMEASGENTDFNEYKIKGLSSMCSSADEQSNIKSEIAGELLSANEIKKESKDYYADEYLQSEQKFHKSPMTTASQHCSPEQAKIKKHKKSKKRQKTPTQDALAKEQVVADTLVKHAPQATNSAFLALTNDTKNTKLLSSPCYDAFDELKRGDTLVTHTSPELQVTAEKKRHKERKEKKREKLRHMSADVGSGVELDKMVYEKEKHRLKKSKKSKSLDVMRQTSTSTTTVSSTVNVQQPLMPAVPAASCTPQHKQRSGGEKMEDIFGPISDEDDEDLSDSDIGGRDLNCIPNRNTSSSNMPGPIVSAALNPYKQEPLTPKSHTVEENEENKQKLTCTTIIGASAHLERVAERQHRKEKREKKRKEREKSRSSEQNQSLGFMPSPAVSTAKPMEDENSVDLDAAGRALEAQLMEDSDNKTLEDATPSTANTYRSDMTDVFLFSDCDENSLEMSSTNKHEKKETEKEHTATISCKNKEKKKKKKRSKEEKQLHHQRRESSSSNASQLASNMVAPSTSTTTKLTIDVQAATKHAQKSSEEHLPTTSSPLCKPSPSLPCLIGDDDDDLNALQAAKSTPNTPLTNVCTSICTTPRRSSSKDMLTLSPHLKDKQMISPIPKTPTINHNSGLNTSENLSKIEATTPSTPTSSMVGAVDNANAIMHTTPTSSTAAAAKSLNKSNDSANSNIMDSPSSSLHTTQQKKKPEIFIPGFDGEIDERISESAVQSISAEFNPILDPMADEPKIPVESPPDASKLEKLEESKSRVTISQEETESAVSALLGESFGNSSADYSFNDDDDGLDDLNNVITDPEPVMAPGEPDEEAALAAKAIECEVASSAIADTVEEDSEEVCKAVQSLRQEELDVKADTPQSVRDLQIDTDTEENVDEADSSGSHSLKIDETAQSNNSSTASDKASTTNPATKEPPQSTTTETEGNPIAKSSVITKVESPTKTQGLNVVSAEPKIEPPTISKQDQPAVQPVQAVLSPVAVEVSVASTASTSAVVSSSSISTSINTTTLAGVTVSYPSTPIKTSITFAPNSTSSSTPKQTHLAIGKSITSPATGYVMQPPTITIPEPSQHFVVPQLVLSPRGVVTNAHHNDSSSSSSSASMHSPSGLHMPPQSPVGAAYLMGVRAQSPHSPRQHTSRGNTPTPRQSSPHTPTPTPVAPIAVTPQHQQQQNILIQRTVQQHQQNLMSPPSQGHVSQNNSPLASPTMQQRQHAQGTSMHKVMPQQQQQSSPNAPEQHMIKINNYSTPPSHNLNMVNIRIPPPSSSQQQHGQLPSPQQQCHGKTVIDPQNQQQQQQHVVPMGQHILPISVQKMPPVPTHPTIISKVVTVTPQQAQQSMMQQAANPGGNMYSPPTTGGSGGNQSRQSPQMLQQLGGKTMHQQQQSPQIQFMQQQQRQQQQHMMQMQQQQMMHQQQKLPQQQQQASLLAQQQQQQTQHNFVVAQQRNLPSPQQIQQQSQNSQQLKVQYQQHQMLAPSQQSPTQQQQNIIQNSPLPQRFLVQQHIVGMPSQQQQQHSGPHQQPQTNSSPNQLQNSSTQQKPTPIYTKQQQQHHHLQQRQQSPSPQRLLQQQPELIKEAPRVIMSTNQSAQPSEQLATTPATSKANGDKHSTSPTTTMSIGNKPAEGVSVIRTPTPTTMAASPAALTTLTPNTIMASNKGSPTTTAAINTSRSVPLTEENVIKISPPKHDEIEQDSKEDSDYWSAKELNVVESNNTSNSNGSSVSTVIKKNESVNSAEATVPAPSLSSTSIAKEQRSEETKSSQTQQNKADSKSSDQAEKCDVTVVNSLESQENTTSYSQSGNVTTDHDTEDETETQQMPAFEQVPVQGRPSTRGTGAKRGRQPRGGKKAAAAAAASVTNSNTAINANVNAQQLQTELGAAAGVQTRLRKPNSGTPATRGRKGRPPRNLLLQQQQMQQQQQQHHEQITPTPQTPSPNSTPTATTTTVPLATTAVLTAAEKKARSQAAVAAAALASLAESNQQQQHQDVYEFHDESGDESKTTTVSTAPTANAANSDHRPRLILTIKSPAPGSTPLVKASEKTVNIESTTVKTLNESPTAHSALPENLGNANQSSIQQTNQAEPTVAELAAAANTRKSRRLLEKDRSTIDDIIEDVVRNTATNAAVANAVANLAATVAPTNVLTSTLPKGAQTPPRRSGRNSSQSKPSKSAEAMHSMAANPIGRPRKSKDRKNTNELDIEQTPSPQPKHIVHDISDVEDAKSISTPPPADINNVQTTQLQSQAIQVSAANTTSLQQPATPQTLTAAASSSMPQHPKKKALAAAEIESFQSSVPTTATPNIHSALPAGGVPMLNTAAPATQKTTGGAADSVNKPLIDPVTGVVSGLQMQHAKEGNLPSATAASQPLRGPMDPKKMMQAAAAAAAAENSTLNSKLLNTSSLVGSVATPITSLTKPQQTEATAAQMVASTVASTMLNKSVSVVVKTSTLPPTSTSAANIVMQQQQQQHLQMSQTNQQSQQHQQQQQQQRQDMGTAQKQPIIMQQQTASVMHAQHTNVRPPTSLKAHVLNSQKLQQQQQTGQQQYMTQQQAAQQQQQTHQMLQTGGGMSQTPTHVIQRPTIATTANQQQLPQANKQLLVNIPPTSLATHPSHAQANALNSPRHLPQHSQQHQQPPQSMSSQQSLVIKQAHDMHTPQVLHVVSSKTSGPTTGPNKPLQSSSTTTVHQQQPPNASPHPSYTTYIQTPNVGVHSKQQLPQKPVVIHQQTLGVPQKSSTIPLAMTPGILPPHPSMVIQTKTSAPAQSPSAGASATPSGHLQHANQHTPSPPLQLPPQHLVKSSNNPMIHSMQTQGAPHALNAVPSTSPPSAVKPNAQQSSIASNVGASSMRTAIPTISPQSQTRILLPGGIQVPAHFETSMSEASFPGGMGRVGVPTREHIMIYQHLLRQHEPLNPPVLREYEEKLLGSSPPLELRRPGSVPRTVAVPHSLQSPQDRATDSPQVAQVYVHNTRIPAHTHYDVTGRAAVAAQPSAYYDASRQIPLEPPPAHRSAPVHSVVAPPPPPTVVVPHPSAGSSSPFMPAAPPASAVQATPSSAPPGHHSKILEREREQREREREQQLLRQKEQIMVRTGADGHSMQVATPPPHQQPSASHQLPPHSQQPPPPQADSLLTLLQRYPVMWQGLLALKTDQAAVQMHFVFGNPHVARASLPCNSDGSTPPLRIAQRMRLEQTQLEGVAKKMQFENEHCMLLALPCGRDHADVLQQSRNLQSGFITYLQQKMAAGIVNIPMPGSEQAAYVVHIFPSCDFANENLEKAAPDLKNRVADIAHLLIVIATV